MIEIVERPEPRFARWCTLVVLALPMLLYLSCISRWSLDLDEIYSLRDSAAPLSDIVRYEKPLYYLVCHLLMVVGVGDVWAIRLPAAIAAGLVPVTFYCLLAGAQPRTARYASLMVGLNPWLFEFSQFGRFYAMMLLFASIAVLGLYRWIVDRRPRWIVGCVVATVLAVSTHPTAVAIVPAGILAVLSVRLGQSWRWRPRGFVAILAVSVATLLITAVAMWLLRPAFMTWWNSTHGRYGNYLPVEVVIGYLLFTGIQVWPLSLLPLFKKWTSWNHAERFFFVMWIATFLPLVLLSPFGGGVAPRYLLCSTPPVFVLAGMAWRRFADRVDDLPQRLAIGVVIMSAYMPMFVSTMIDGNHCDYRSAVAYVESITDQQPTVACTAHDLYRYYSQQPVELYELHALADWHESPETSEAAVVRQVVQLVAEAEQSRRPMFLVSREDRRGFDPSVRQWLAQHFVTLRTFEKSRLDHRRNQIIVYQLRDDRG